MWCFSEIVSVDGTHSHDARSEILDWQLDCIDGGNPTGTLEFNIAQKDEGAFFPIEVSFRSSPLYYDGLISSVESTEEPRRARLHKLDKKVTHSLVKLSLRGRAPSRASAKWGTNNLSSGRRERRFPRVARI